MTDGKMILQALIGLQRGISDIKNRKDDPIKAQLSEGNVVIHRQTLLAEDQFAVQCRFKQLCVAKRIQDHLLALKSTVKHLSQELQVLKSALYPYIKQMQTHLFFYIDPCTRGVSVV